MNFFFFPLSFTASRRGDKVHISLYTNQGPVDFRVKRVVLPIELELYKILVKATALVKRKKSKEEGKKDRCIQNYSYRFRPSLLHVFSCPFFFLSLYSHTNKLARVSVT